MKQNTSSVFLSLLAMVCASTPFSAKGMADSPENLRSRFESALIAKDTNGLVALFNSARMTNELAESAGMREMMIMQEINSTFAFSNISVKALSTNKLYTAIKLWRHLSQCDCGERTFVSNLSCKCYLLTPPKLLPIPANFLISQTNEQNA